VLNKVGVPKRQEISIKDIETHLGNPVSQSIPFAAESFGRCVNEGKTLFAIAPKSKEAVAIINVARQFLRSCPIAWCSFWLPLTAFGLARAVDVMPTQLAG
jgi:Flp pilus assembly CpaE family ATPase